MKEVREREGGRLGGREGDNVNTVYLFVFMYNVSMYIYLFNAFYVKRIEL